MKIQFAALTVLATLSLLICNQVAATPLGLVGRLQVLDTMKDHYRPIGQIATSSGFCTGTLVSPVHVVTAGHCVYDTKTRISTEAATITFTPALNKFLVNGVVKTFEPFRPMKVATYMVHEDYLRFHSEASDLAVLTLATPVDGKTVKWFQIDTQLKGFSVEPSRLGGWRRSGVVQGYPADMKPFGSMWLASCSFYIPNTPPYYKPIYDCDTFGGMSGAALVTAVEKGQPVIFGVHTSGERTLNSGVNFAGHNTEFLRRALMRRSLPQWPQLPSTPTR